jgi:helicase required for RNAi-mediated heterochromatin assembly 1
VELDGDIGAPDYLEENSFLNLSSLVREETDSTAQQPASLSEEEDGSLYNANMLDGFPNIPSSGMDDSQMAACQRMVTKKVSIVQGPPGTGKTFTSVSALRVLIENLSSNSPIIIAAQTNHALDQLMNHVLAFEPSVVRLGGRSDKENVEIIKRTLYMLRMSTKDFPDGSKGMKSVYATLQSRVEEIQMTMAPLLTDDILTDEMLLDEGIINEVQKQSLYEEGWVSSENSGAFDDMTALAKCNLPHLRRNSRQRN